jgi:lysophospholipase L1-like esterase
VTTDGLGFRSPELDLKRDKVVILGDSVAWGWGVADRDSLSSRLQETLASASYQVVNMAVPGYGTDQELVWLDRNIARVKARHGIRLVILVICSHNDLRNIAVPWSEGRAKPSVRLVAGKVVMRGPVMKYGLTNLLSASFLPLAWTQHLLSALMKRTPSDEAKSLMARLLDQMQLLVESRGGAKFAVVLSPSIVAFRSKNARRQEEYAWFRQMLSNRRFPVLDFKKTLDRQRAPERLFLEDGVHFTPAGNELLARAVYTNLIKPIIRDGDRPLASRSSR